MFIIVVATTISSFICLLQLIMADEAERARRQLLNAPAEFEGTRRRRHGVVRGRNALGRLRARRRRQMSAD